MLSVVVFAAHLTLKLIDLQPNNTIHLWMNKQFEIHDFDADPGWLGPKNMNRFHKLNHHKTYGYHKPRTT